MRGNPHVRFGPGAAGKAPATSAGTSPAAYRGTAVEEQAGAARDHVDSGAYLAELAAVVGHRT
ncbi:hypothetical protein [Pseudonocardia humida]|uniref:Uncharacterized protein n=1 Tax=Pseudonocardia humida TaxID=2800819 RepID=A0ABT0ZSX5_9PSEU|nr:hypothetical protein [Pseudonocardia humida]MCO1653845.1 hypothetical protein [Pseudonocardia humida]